MEMLTISRQLYDHCKMLLNDYLRYVEWYSLFHANIAIIYEKDNAFKHFSVVCLYILVCVSGHLC